MQTKWARILVLAVLALTALTAVACSEDTGSTDTGSTDASSTDSSSGGGSSTDASGGSSGSANADVGGKTIGIVNCCRNAEGAKRIEDGIADAAKAAGWKSTGVDGAADPNKWNSAAMDFVNKGVDAIFLDAIDAPVVAPAIAAAKKANIPVVGVVVPAFPQYTLYTSIDMTAVGASQTQYMVDKLGPKGGKVALLEYCVGISKLKCLGRDAVLKVNKQVDVVAKVYEDPADALGNGRKTMAEVLQANPDLDAVWAYGDPTGVGATQAIDAAGKSKDIWVTAENGDANALDLIRSGTSPMVMTIGSPLEQSGWAAVDQLLAYFAKGDYQSTQVPFVTLTKDNVDKYTKPGQPFEGVGDYQSEYEQSWQEKYGIGG